MFATQRSFVCWGLEKVVGRFRAVPTNTTAQNGKQNERIRKTKTC